MDSFIRVTEIWVPSEDKQELILTSYNAGPLTYFGRMSQQDSFAFGEGLPGKSWELARPVIIKQFENSAFVRKEIAQEVGLTSAIAIPIFGTELKAVVVFLCGDNKNPDGAIEFWQDDSLSGMSLVDGYYGGLSKFEWISQRVKFPKGRGLPGLVWEKQTPVVIGNISNSNSFLRSRHAAESGITTGLGFPFFTSEDAESQQRSVITLLSTNTTPIAQRFEIWLPNPESQTLLLHSDIEIGQAEVSESQLGQCIELGQGIVGMAWEQGIPFLSDESSNSVVGVSHGSESAQYSLAIPILQGEEVNSVIVLVI